MKARQINRIKLIVGGVIPPDDVEELKRLGVGCVRMAADKRNEW